MGNPSTSLQGNMTSVYNLGCFLGALSTIWTGDILGRPRILLLGSTIIAVGGILQAASYSVAQIMVGRIVAGCGTGMNTATAGVWQAETSRMRSRGKLITIQMASCIFGVLVSNFLTLGLSFAPGAVAWRFPLAFQCGKSTQVNMSPRKGHVYVSLRPDKQTDTQCNSLLHSHLGYVPFPAGFTASAYSSGT